MTLAVENSDPATKTRFFTGQTFTQGQLVINEVMRAIYKTPAGGRLLGASGYVVQSDIESTIDTALFTGDNPGALPILLDRQVSQLSASGDNRLILPWEVAIPGTINLTEF